MLGTNPTFFVVHNVDGASLALFGLVVVLIPPLVATAVLGITRLAVRPALPVVTTIVIGALVALALVPIIDRTARLSTAVFVGLLLVTAIAAGWSYRRWLGLRTYTTYLAPAPILFLVIFLFASSSSALLDGIQDVDAAALHGSNTPIIVVVFDEFPLGVILDGNGQIDAARFPGFARLAAISTWYPKAVTVAPFTHLAVPALLTGELPSDPVAVAATHPRSLFTLFDRSHHLEVTEAFTHLCPEDVCASQPVDEAELAHDTSVVYLHSLLPDDLAEDWLPAIGERWSGFTDHEPTTDSQEGKDVTVEDFKLAELFALVGQRDKQPARFASFLSSIRGDGDRPGLWFHHSVLPHLPNQYLTDGRRYDDTNLDALAGPGLIWVDDADLLAGAVQRLAIQTAAVDRLVSALLDQIEEQGLLDDALVVVTADHGITFAPGRGPRGQSATNKNDVSPIDAQKRDDLLPVPLFIKYPGESTGRVDDRAAQTIDVLPTIVDSLDLALPPGWSFDGASLLGRPLRHRALHFTTDTGATERVTITDDIDAGRMARYVQSVFVGPSGTERDFYRIQPFGALVGHPAAPLVTGGAVGTVAIDPPDVYDDVDLAGIIPALFEGRVSGVRDDGWLAVALDGTIAGTGPAYVVDGELWMVAMLDPAFIHNGHHTVAVYLINSSGSLRPLTTR